MFCLCTSTACGLVLKPRPLCTGGGEQVVRTGIPVLLREDGNLSEHQHLLLRETRTQLICRNELGGALLPFEKLMASSTGAGNDGGEPTTEQAPSVFSIQLRCSDDGRMRNGNTVRG